MALRSEPDDRDLIFERDFVSDNIELPESYIVKGVYIRDGRTYINEIISECNSDAVYIASSNNNG